VYDPLHDEIFEAATSLGAFCNGQTLTVAPIASFDQATIGFGYSSSCSNEITSKAIREWMSRGAKVRSPGAGALAITYVAAGRLSGFYEQALYVWDWAAACVIVKEAGGWVDFTFEWDAPKKPCQFIAGVPGLNIASGRA
jgi:myo-inositol-1(or 4)-monophosphatase